MRKYAVTIPEVALVAITRGMGGAGIGLLAAGTLSDRTRRIAGLALLAVGVLSTVPLVLEIFARRAPIAGRDFERLPVAQAQNELDLASASS